MWCSIDDTRTRGVAPTLPPLILTACLALSHTLSHGSHPSTVSPMRCRRRCLCGAVQRPGAPSPPLPRVQHRGRGSPPAHAHAPVPLQACGHLRVCPGPARRCRVLAAAPHTVPHAAPRPRASAYDDSMSGLMGRSAGACACAGCVQFEGAGTGFAVPAAPPPVESGTAGTASIATSDEPGPSVGPVGPGPSGLGDTASPVHPSTRWVSGCLGVCVPFFLRPICRWFL